MKKLLVSTLLLLLLALPGQAEELKDYLIRGMPDYKLEKQLKNFNQLEINSRDPERDEDVKTIYEGNFVFSEYRYDGDKTTMPGVLQIKRYYQAALQRLGGRLLWEDDSNFHASFERGGKQHYMTVWASGDYYRAYILELANLEVDDGILLDDDVKTSTPATQATQTTPATQTAQSTQTTPSRGLNQDFYTLGNDQITSITKLVGQRRVINSDTITRDGTIAYVIEYITDPADHTQAANDVAVYFQYLRANEGFIALKSFDGLPFEGGVEMQFAKDSTDEGNIIILDIEYNSKGYKLLFRKGEGTLTRN